MCTRGAALTWLATRGRRDVDTCIAPATGSLAGRAGPVTSRVLCNTSPVAILRQAGRASGSASCPIAAHRTADWFHAGGGTFVQATRFECAVTDTHTAAVVPARVATNRAGTVLADRRTVRIRGAPNTLRSTGGRIIIGRAGTPALVMCGTAGKRTSPTRRAPVASCSRWRGAWSTLNTAGIRAGIRRANAAAIVRARGTLVSAGCRGIDACAVAEFLGSGAGASANTG